MTIRQMKGNPPRLDDGRLKPLHGNTKLATIEKDYQRDYFKGLPRPDDGIVTLGDARRYYTEATGHKVVGVKEIKKLALHDYLPHIPRVSQDNYIAQIAMITMR